jgi:hypothetical protein
LQRIARRVLTRIIVPVHAYDGGTPVKIEGATQQPALESSDIRGRVVSPLAEFCCWVVVCLAPFLRWVNGAAVTDDQFLIQMGLVTLAMVGAIGLRIYNWRSA